MTTDDDEMEAPQPAQPEAEKKIRRRTGGARKITIPRTHGDGDINLRLASVQMNDIGNAMRLIERFGDDLIYVKDHGWLAWDGRRWNGDDGDRQAQLFAHRTAAAIFGEYDALSKEPPLPHETEKQWNDRMDKLRKWSNAAGNSNRINAMLAEAMPYLTKTIDQLDSDPMLFNVKNGTLDLRGTVTLRKHNRKDYITKLAPVNYNRSAQAPNFHTFLASIMPKADDQVFLQSYFGYCMTGDTSEQKLLLCQGTGSNGKSTLTEAIAHIFGDYAMTLPFASLLHNDRSTGSQASPDIARLPGARLVTAAEPETGSRFSESLLKGLTGGDTIVARHLNQGFFEYKPQFKLALLFNNKPTIRGQDEGIWRRLMMLPFGRFFTEDEKDRRLPHKLREEADGILNWLVDGVLIWGDRGIKMPESVREATQNYRSESDPLGQFLDVATERVNGFSETAKELYAAYCMWCEKNSLTPLKNNSFGRKLSDRGIERSKSSNITYTDIKLLEEFRPQRRGVGHTGSHSGEEDIGDY